MLLWPYRLVQKPASNSTAEYGKVTLPRFSEVILGTLVDVLTPFSQKRWSMTLSLDTLHTNYDWLMTFFNPCKQFRGSLGWILFINLVKKIFSLSSVCATSCLFNLWLYFEKLQCLIISYIVWKHHGPRFSVTKEEFFLTALMVDSLHIVHGLDDSNFLKQLNTWTYG